MAFKSLLFGLLFVIFYPNWVWSKDQKLFLPLFIGQSGTGGASLQEDLSYIINPASLAFQTKSKLAVHYSLQDQTHNGMLSVLDLKSRLPIAVNYQRSWEDSFNSPKASYWLINSGFRLGSSTGLGASVRKNLVSSNWNLSLGSLLRLSSHFAIGLYMDNLLKENRKNQQNLSLAAYYSWKKFFLSQVDISRSHSDWIFKGSVQSLFHPFFSVRLGGFITLKKLEWSTRDTQALSGALSFNSPRLSLEYGIQKKLLNYEHSLTLLLKI